MRLLTRVLTADDGEIGEERLKGDADDMTQLKKKRAQTKRRFAGSLASRTGGLGRMYSEFTHADLRALRGN